MQDQLYIPIPMEGETECEYWTKLVELANKVTGNIESEKNDYLLEYLSDRLNEVVKNLGVLEWPNDDEDVLINQGKVYATNIIDILLDPDTVIIEDNYKEV